MSDDEEFDSSTEEAREVLLNIAKFQAASTEFSDNATELMAASVRMQMLMLDDAKMTLAEVADSLSVAARNRRAADETQG